MGGVPVTSARYSTEQVAPRDRFAYWREAICAVYVKLDAEPTQDAAFTGDLDVQDWTALRLSRVTAGGQWVRRQRGEDGGDCLLSLQLRGTGRVGQAGRVAELGPGDMALYDAARPYDLRFAGPFQQVVVQFPRQELLDRDVDLEHGVAQRLGAGSAMAAVTASLLRSMRDNAPGLSSLDRERLSVQALDCIAAALTPSAPGGDGARRAAVLAHVHRHLHDPELTVTSIAGAFGMSTRSLQRLFVDDHAALGERIRRLRLRRATSRLVSDRQATVAQVAADHGYCDAAHFARAFRAEHGCSPTEFRAQQLSYGGRTAVAPILDTAP